MRVTFWGVRGSIPTPGPSTIRYGGNTSSIEVEVADGTRILLDAGTGLRELGRRWAKEGVVPPLHLLVTHAHTDHVMGLLFFPPLFRPDAELVVHPIGGDLPLGPEQLFDGLRFPLTLDRLPGRIVRAAVTDALAERTIGSARVRAIRLNHPGGATGYRIDDADGASLVLYTDQELPGGVDHVTPHIRRDDLIAFARGAQLLVHDAQYVDHELPHRAGRGHSTISAVLELARNTEVQALALYHHDPDRSDDALDVLGRDAARWWQAQVGAGEVLVAQEGMSLVLDGRTVSRG